MNSFKVKFSEVILGLEEKDIINRDDYGLLFQAMPDKTLATTGDKWKSGRKTKDRLTVLLAASVTGEKLPPFVVDKVDQPRC